MPPWNCSKEGSRSSVTTAINVPRRRRFPGLPHFKRKGEELDLGTLDDDFRAASNYTNRGAGKALHSESRLLSIAIPRELLDGCGVVGGLVGCCEC